MRGFIFATCLALAAVAVAQPRDLRTEALLARALASVAAHEGALESPADLDLIWQVVQWNADTPAEQLYWLRAHSPRALGRKPCQGGNCRWSVPLSQSVIPAQEASGVSEGYMRTVTLPRFNRLLERARYLVAGGAYDKPCSIEPRSWGAVGRRGLDDRPVAARVFQRFPIGCKGELLNDGFAPRSAFVGAEHVDR